MSARPTHDNPADWLRARCTIIESGCWEWISPGNITKGGYARIKYRGEYMPAHRLSYCTFVGPLNDGNVLDHLCRNRKCINPAHLRQVDRLTNTLENSVSLPALNALKTHCPQGHEYDRFFTQKNGRPGRWCKRCSSATALKRYYKRKKELAT